MDVYRRIPSGRMSELFGNTTFDTDVMMREFGLARAAKNMLNHLNKTDIDNLQSYADGINDCADSLTILPLEY